MKRILLVVAALLISAAVVLVAQADAPPLSLEGYANADQVGPGRSVAYTIAVRRTALDIGDVSVRVELDRGLEVLDYGANDGGCGRSETVIVCVVPVSADNPGLVSFAVRLDERPRCARPLMQRVSAATKFTGESASLVIETPTDPCMWLPLIAPQPTHPAYPAP